MTDYEENVWRVIVKLAEWYPWGMTTSALRTALVLPEGQPQGILRSLQNNNVVGYTARTRQWHLVAPVGHALAWMPGLNRLGLDAALGTAGTRSRGR